MAILPIPVPMNPLYSLAGVGAGVGAWVLYRNQQRNELVQKMEDNPAVFAARVYAKDVQLGPEHAWLKQPRGLQTKAAELLPYWSTKSVDDAFSEVKSSLPKIPVRVGTLPGLIDKGFEFITSQTGVKVPGSVQREVSKQTKTEEGQLIEGLVTSAQGLWSWSIGEEAKPNCGVGPAEDPNLSWTDFLGCL